MNVGDFFYVQCDSFLGNVTYTTIPPVLRVKEYKYLKILYMMQ